MLFMYPYLLGFTRGVLRLYFGSFVDETLCILVDFYGGVL